MQHLFDSLSNERRVVLLNRHVSLDEFVRELGDRSFRHDFAFLQQRKPIGSAPRERNVLLNQNHRDTVLAVQPHDHGLDLLNDVGLNALGRLIQKDDLRLRQQGSSDGKLLLDASGEKAPGGPDGIRVDKKGNIYGSGPGGVWIISPEGKHLGTIKVPEVVANVAWGDKDGKTLYITASTSLYRIKLSVPGVRN